MIDNFKLMKKIIKDYDVPIQPVSLNHIEYAIRSFPYIFDCDDAIEFSKMYMSENDCNVEQFDSATHRITQNCIDNIKSLDSYKLFNEKTVPKSGFVESRDIHYSKGLDIYKTSNNHKRMVSIDLTKANLQSFIQEDVIPLCTFEEFLTRYGGVEDENLLYYIANSKRLRQIIFGNLNPPRQQSFEKVMIEKILDLLLMKHIIYPEDVYGYTTDEIILNYTDNISDLDDRYYANIYYAIKDYGIKIHTEDFILEKIEPYDFWVKVDPITMQPYKFKKVPIVYYLQVLKHVFKKPIEEEDLMFQYENLPCKFVTKLWEDD